MARESTIGSTFYLEESREAGTAITATTKGKTTSLTVGALPAGAVAGGWAFVSGTGHKSLDRKSPHRIVSASASAVVLQTDSSADVAGTEDTPMITVAKLVETCFSEFSPDSPAPGEVDVTTMCDTERRTVAGLSSVGSISFGGPLDMSDKGIQHLIASRNDGLARALVWVTRGGQAASMFGQVSSFVGAPQGVEQAVTFSGSFQVQEGPFYMDNYV